MKPLNYIKQLVCFTFILLLTACDGTSSGFPAPDCGDTNNDCPEFVTMVTTPNVASLLIGMQQQFKANAIYADVSSQDISQRVTWSVDNTTIATIDKQGLLTANNSGEVIVTAELEGYQSNAKVTIIHGVAEKLAIFPSSNIFVAGTSEQYSAFVTLMDGQVIDVTTQSVWTMQDTNVATIDSVARVSALIVGDTQLKATFTHDNTSLEAQSALSVTAADVSEIVISPENAKFPIGSFGIYRATAYFPDGHTQDITRDATWSSSNDDVGRIIGSGVNAGDAVAIALGETDIQVNFHSKKATTKATVTDSILLSISITPVDKVTPAGTQVDYQAYGLYSDGTKHEITKLAIWSVSQPAVANIAINGTAQTFIAGETDITATYTGLSQTATLTVSDAIVESLQITPQNPSVAKATTGQFTAVATYSDKTTADVTQQANWSTADHSVAQIMPAGENAGYAVALKEGKTAVSATVNGVAANTELTVTAATISSLSLTPSRSELPVGTTEQLQLFALFNDGSSVDHTTDASFQSSNPTALTVDNSGLATAHAESATDVVITATYAGEQTTALIRITDALLQSIEVTPATQTFPVGQKGALKAWALYSDNNIKNITHQATWSVDDGDIASVDNTVSNAGDVLGINEGTVTVTASFQGKTATNSTIIKPPATAVLESVSISPVNASVIAGLNQQYTLTAQFSDKTSLDVTTSSDWISSDNNTATIDSVGLATGHLEGQVTITGTYQGLSADTSLTVLSAILASIQISPINPTEAVGTTGRFTAMGFYSDGYSVDLSNSITWSSSDSSVVSIVAKGYGGGQASADKVGSATIKAEISGISSTTLATVIEAPLQSIVISPATADIAQGMFYQYTATAIYGNGLPAKDITNSAHWSTNDSAISTITSSGYAKGEAQGVATITASYQGQSATAMLNIGAPELSHILLLPAVNTLPLGISAYYQAIAFDSAGKDYVINNDADWSITNTTIAHVDNSETNGGLVTPLSTGSTQVVVNFLGKRVTAELTVTGAMITSLEIAPIGPTIVMKENQQFTATAFYSDSSSKEVTDLASWQSSDTDVATVHSSLAGLLMSHTYGTTEVKATFDGYSAQTILTVQEIEIDNLQITPHVNHITVGEQVQLKCSIIYVGGSLGDCTDTSLWTTADDSIAHIEPAGGLVTAVKAGNTRAFATYHGVTSKNTDGQVSVTNPVLESISVTPDNKTLAKEQPQTYQAMGHYDNGDITDISHSVDWTVADNAVGKFNGSSTFFPVDTGTTQVIATNKGITGETSVTISERVFYTGDIVPDPINLTVGDELDLQCFGDYVIPPSSADSITIDITQEVTWGLTYSDKVATISNEPGSKGHLVAIKAGTNTVQCQLPMSNGSWISIRSSINVSN